MYKAKQILKPNDFWEKNHVHYQTLVINLFSRKIVRASPFVGWSHGKAS